MDKTRLRAPNFTASDNMLLCGILAKFKQVIENKKTDGASLRQKHAAWLEVVKIYNSNTTGCTRTLESLQQTYKNLKKKAKVNASDAKIPGKRKLDLETSPEQTVSEKLKKLDIEKTELVELQLELLRTQLEDHKEKLEHNRRLRAMEMEEMEKKYGHNEIIRKLELERYDAK